MFIEHVLYSFILAVRALSCKRNEMECMGAVLRTCTDDGYWTEMPCPDGTTCAATKEAVSCKRIGRDVDVLIDNPMIKKKRGKETGEQPGSESDDRMNVDSSTQEQKPKRKREKRQKPTEESSPDTPNKREKTVIVTRTASDRSKSADEKTEEKTVTVTKVPKEIDLEVSKDGKDKQNYRFMVKTIGIMDMPAGKSTMEYEVQKKMMENPPMQQGDTGGQMPGVTSQERENQLPSSQKGQMPSSSNDQLPEGQAQIPSSSSGQLPGGQSQMPTSQGTPGGEQTNTQPAQSQMPPETGGGQATQPSPSQPGQQQPGPSQPGQQQPGPSQPSQQQNKPQTDQQQNKPQTDQQQNKTSLQQPSQQQNKPQPQNQQSAQPTGPSSQQGQQPASAAQQSTTKQAAGGSKPSEGSKEGNKTGEQGGSQGTGGGQVITVEQLNKAMKESQFNPNPQYVQLAVKNINAKYKDKEMVAMLIAQLAHESGGFQFIEEIECKGNKCPGRYDQGGLPGKQYYGRGLIQLTHPDNYKKAGAAIGMGDKLFQDPDMVAKNPELAVKVSLWYWDAIVLAAPGVKDKKQFGLTTKAINGPLECGKGPNPQAQKRYKIYQTVAKTMGVTNLAANTGC